METGDEPRAESHGHGAGGHAPLFLLLAAAFLLGLWLRTDGLAETPLFGDEHHSLKTASQPADEVLTGFDKVGSHVLTPLLQHWSLELFGGTPFALRLPALVPGLLTLLVIAAIAGRLGGAGAACIAAAWTAVLPMHVFYSRFARPYALEVLLVLLLAGGTVLLIERRRPFSALRFGVIFTAALTLYCHLSSAGAVAGIAVAYALSSFLAERKPCRLYVPLLTFGLAGLVALALYAPVLEPLKEYLGKERESESSGPLSWFELPVLLGGSAVGGALLIASATLGAVVLARRSGPSGSSPGAAAILVGCVLGPLLLLLVTRPFGMGYAYARYLIPSLPAALVLGSIGLGAIGNRLGIGGGVLVAVATAALVHFAPARAAQSTFSNTYLALHALPAFDQPWDGGSKNFYDRIAEDEEVQAIIEVPLMRSRTVLLYRAHQLRHGKDVKIGVGQAGIGPLLKGPAYVDLSGEEWREGAQWLVVHHKAKQELFAYRDWVYGAEFDGVDAGLMERNRRFLAAFPDAAALPQGLGPPDFQDRWIMAWRLPPDAP